MTLNYISNAKMLFIKLKINYLCAVFIQNGPSTGTIRHTTTGEMQEWLNWHAWKACKPLKGFKGSNPFLSANEEKSD